MNYNKKTTEKDKKEARKFLKKYNVRLHFVRKGWSSACVDTNLIEIDVREVKILSDLWSMVFHELSHILCAREGLYKKYHTTHSNSRKFAIYMHRYGLRAERFVDKKAAKLMKQYFPDMEYVANYNTEEGVRYYRKWLNRYYPINKK